MKFLLAVTALALSALAAITLLQASPDRATAIGGANSISSPDTEGVVGYGTSLALDSAGNPVISYVRAVGDGNEELRVLHCDDPTCENESGNATIADLRDLDGRTSLKLDSGGNPVISYQSRAVGAHPRLWLMHCDDPACQGGETGQNVGAYGMGLSLELDAAGNPVVSYYVGWTWFEVRLLHCGDPDCLVTATTTVVDPCCGGDLGSSLELDSSGYPVISYYENSNDIFWLMHCGDAYCSAGNTKNPFDIAGLGGSTSMVLDGNGYPSCCL